MATSPTAISAPASADKIYPLMMEPGVQRDGTGFAKKNWIDAQWVRFYRGLPKKMAGYQQLALDDSLSPSMSNIPRGLFVVPQSPNYVVYFGDYEQLFYFIIDFNGNPIAPVSSSRTPAVLAVDPNNNWTFDVMFDTISDNSILLAFCAPNLAAIDSEINRPIYYGNINDTTPLIPTGQSVSGGMVVLQPYLFTFGNDGYVSWSNANDPTTIMGTARVAPYKIVYGLPTRGGNSSPAGLLWSLDRLIRVTNVGTVNAEGIAQIAWSFDTITTESSILSSRSVIENDGVYYWAGVDRFLSYNGVVQELPNNMSLEYFYNNVNYNQRQKVWASKVPQWSEIWWFYPAGNANECTNALIYNIRNNCWYDVAITRGDGYYDQTFAQPIWADNTPTIEDEEYVIWLHEQNIDQVTYDPSTGAPIFTAIDAYIESGSISWVGAGPDRGYQEIDRWIYLYRLEPDFLQTGDMTLVVNGRDYARAPVVSSTPYTFTPNTVKIDMREQRREMTLRFESNTIGGDFEMGQILMVMRIGDGRQGSGN